MKFAKPSLSIADQITLLEARGMAVPDTAHAAHCLQHISYYRLRAYWLPFEEAAPADGEHKFKDGTSFDDVLALYAFDRRLRLHVMDAIERIEVSLRGSWAHHLAMKYGPHGYLDPGHYDRADYYAKAFASLIEEIERSKDTFIVHYRTKYDDPEHPPIWMTAEVMSLGQLSKWLGNLKLRGDRQAIAKPYGLDEKVLVSVAHHQCPQYLRTPWSPLEQAVYRDDDCAALAGIVEAGDELRVPEEALQHAGGRRLYDGDRCARDPVAAVIDRADEFLPTR